MSKATDKGSAQARQSEAPAGSPDPSSLPDEFEKLRGVPKTPQGWWTLGLIVMAILIAVALCQRYT